MNKKYAMDIGLLLIATGRYDQFVQPLIDSARKFFFKDYNVTYFLFTDSGKWNNEKDIVVTFMPHEPFPAPTLKRYETFDKNRELFVDADYLFYCDVDMLFAGEVGEEILAERVATIHPGFMGGRGTPETRRESLACVLEGEDMIYFAGGFNGGSREEFLKMSKELSENIQADADHNITAIWHDESHMNRYFIDNPPVKILSPSYCYPESWDLPLEKKILALDKNHAAVRG
jgi:histo-blood group ABO system transferase